MRMAAMSSIEPKSVVPIVATAANGRSPAFVSSSSILSKAAISTRYFESTGIFLTPS